MGGLGYESLHASRPCKIGVFSSNWGISPNLNMKSTPIQNHVEYVGSSMIVLAGWRKDPCVDLEGNHGAWS